MEKKAIRQMEYTPVHGEINNSPSETIQGQSLTVNEILIKFSQGTLPNIVLDYYYDNEQEEEIDFDSIDPTLDPSFDLADATELQNQAEFEQLRAKQKENDAEIPETKKSGSEEPETP